MITISRTHSVKVYSHKSFEQVSKKIVSMVSKLEKNRLTTLKENVSTLATIANKDIKTLYDVAVEVDTFSKDLLKYTYTNDNTENENDNVNKDNNIFLNDSSTVS